MLEKKEEHLTKKIEEELKKARANASSNKRCELFVQRGICYRKDGMRGVTGVSIGIRVPVSGAIRELWTLCGHYRGEM